MISCNYVKEHNILKSDVVDNIPGEMLNYFALI